MLQYLLNPVSLQPLNDLSLAQWEEIFTSWGEPRFRARQLSSWVCRSQVLSFAEMTNLPPAFRDRLAQNFVLESLSLAEERSSADGLTRKTLFLLQDGQTVETVLMRYPRWSTVCLSTQVGCPIGCPFCATGKQGWERNLSPAEMVDQVLYFSRRGVGSISRVVFMGMGEPLLNYEATWQAVRTLNSPWGRGIGARHITLSTAGVVPGILRLAQEGLQVELAVSLHAAENALRDGLVPLNRRYPLEELLTACGEFSRQTGRRVTFEYVLLAGINDALSSARQLAHRLRGIHCLVNLIPANDCGDPAFRPPTPEGALAFKAELERCGVTVTQRASRGAEIWAGCGQLRSRAGAGHIGQEALGKWSR